jgi:predicted GNAT family N-acyltransferase
MPDIKRITFKDKDYAEMAFAIRRKVFVEEEGVDANLEYDIYEETAHHYLLFLSGRPIATARWRETVEGIKMERFAVLPEFRNRGFGEIMLREMLSDTVPMKRKIYLHSQLRAVPFYERNGFEKKGEIFYEAGLGHYYMEWR